MKCCRIDFDKAGDPVKCPKRARIMIDNATMFAGFCNRKHLQGPTNPSRAQIAARGLAKEQARIRQEAYTAKYGGAR